MAKHYFTPFNNRLNHQKSSMAGITLVEIVVSIFLMAIGLLAIAQLQVKTIRYNNTAALKSQAVLLIENLIDRMRSSGLTDIVSTANMSSITTSNTKACTGKYDPSTQFSYNYPVYNFSYYNLDDSICDEDDNCTYQPGSGATTDSAPQQPIHNVEANYCTPQELADFEINTWATEISKLLPEGKGTISQENGYTVVMVEWKESVGDSTNTSNDAYHNYAVKLKLD